MVGSSILLECVKKNESTRAIYRRTESLNHIKHLFEKLIPDKLNSFEQIEWVKADLNDLEALNAAFKGVKCVYHCAAKVSLVQFQNKRLIKTNIEGTANIVNLCIKHNIKKLGYVSSIASLGAEFWIPGVTISGSGSQISVSLGLGFSWEINIWNPNKNNKYRIF